MKTIGERDTRKKRQKKKTNKQRQKRARRDRSYSERMRAELFCCAFKLGFPQLICKASLIFIRRLKHVV